MHKIIKFYGGVEGYFFKQRLKFVM